LINCEIETKLFMIWDFNYESYEIKNFTCGLLIIRKELNLKHAPFGI